MNDPNIHTEAVNEEEVAKLDWGAEFQPLNHPVKTKISEDAKTIYDIKTGNVIAELNEGYKWYWFHSHLHVRPEFYNMTADDQEKLRLEGQGLIKNDNPSIWLARAMGAITKAISYTEDKEKKEKLYELLEAVKEEKKKTKTSPIAKMLKGVVTTVQATQGALIESPVNELP